VFVKIPEFAAAMETSMPGLFLDEDARSALSLDEKPFWKTLYAIYRNFVIAGAVLGAAAGAALFLALPFVVLILAARTRMGV
jgi:hypothetical protein